MNLKEIIANKLAHGKTLPLMVIVCEKCDNQFIVLNESKDFEPNYCCYCGVKFNGL